MDRHLQFEVDGLRLLGALHEPLVAPESGPRGAEQHSGTTGLLLLHGWAGYRIGAHRMFVKLARAAAAAGLPCLRFDFRGRGDSEGDMMATTLSSMIQDACAAARVLCDETGVERIALVGDCSGSEVAIGAGAMIDACQSMVLWSAPIVGGSREQSDKAKRKHIVGQYLSKLFRPQTWAKLVTGRLQVGMIRKAVAGGGKGAGEQGSQKDSDIDWGRRFRTFDGDMLFIYGDRDPTAEACLEHYKAMTGATGRPWHSHLVSGANHAFYSVQWEREVITTTLTWVSGPATVGGGHGR